MSDEKEFNFVEEIQKLSKQAKKEWVDGVPHPGQLGKKARRHRSKKNRLAIKHQLHSYKGEIE